jgi:hypothetical protein
MLSLPNSYAQPEAMPTSIKTPPINKEWLSRLTSMWWSSVFDGTPADEREQKRFNANRRLINKILTFGGHEVCMPTIEDDLVDLMTRGVLVYGKKAQMMKGLASQCHSNSAALWEKNSDSLVIMTGYGLSNDGMWRQHSWCAHSVDGRIVETTEKRIAYFGFVMSNDEAEKFASDNF